MKSNKNLQAANYNKKDEFYTTYEDIKKEMIYYIDEFKDKTIYCNCDNPYKSNFFRYFFKNFNRLGLKNLIATYYDPYKEELKLAEVVKLPEEEFGHGDKKVGIHCSYSINNSNGDFRSRKSVKILKASDIIVTNPPFSLFREFIAQLLQYKKKFLILGNVNALSYQEIFPYIMSNEITIGPSIRSGDRKFFVPDDYPLEAATCGVDDSGKKFIKVKGVRWFTNLKPNYESKFISLTSTFAKDKYPVYDNYKAIEVSSTKEIPKDYSGIMGVPITFIDKYNPEQFEIVGADFQVKNGQLKDFVHSSWTGKVDRAYLNGKRLYARIFILNKSLKT